MLSMVWYPHGCGDHKLTDEFDLARSHRFSCWSDGSQRNAKFDVTDKSPE